MTIKLTHKFFSDYDYHFVKSTLISIYGKCQVSGEPIFDANLVKLHHMMPNTKINRLKYPYMIDSMFNLVPVLLQYQDQENRIKVSEIYAFGWNSLLEKVCKDLWIGKKVSERFMLNKEVERIKDYQRTRGNIHYNVTLSKRELKELDKEAVK